MLVFLSIPFFLRREDMSNEKIPYLDITLDDGETYHVKCSLRVINQFQLMTGRNLLQTTGEGFSTIEMTQLIACAIFPKDTQENLDYVADNIGASCAEIFVRLVHLLLTGKEPTENANKTEAAEKKSE